MYSGREGALVVEARRVRLDSEFEAQSLGSGFGVDSFGFLVSEFGSSLGFGVLGFGFRVSGIGFSIWGSELRSEKSVCSGPKKTRPPCMFRISGLGLRVHTWNHGWLGCSSNCRVQVPIFGSQILDFEFSGPGFGFQGPRLV